MANESFIKQMTQIMKDNGVRIEFRFDSVLNCLDVYIMKRGCGGCHFMMSDEAMTWAIECVKHASKPWCKFRSEKNCDFCAFHSDCEIHWKDGDEE